MGIKMSLSLPVLTIVWSFCPTSYRTFLDSSHIIKIALQKSMDRATVHLTLRFWRKILVESMIVMKMMILWENTLMLRN